MGHKLYNDSCERDLFSLTWSLNECFWLMCLKVALRDVPRPAPSWGSTVLNKGVSKISELIINNEVKLEFVEKHTEDFMDRLGSGAHHC